MKNIILQYKFVLKKPFFLRQIYYLLLNLKTIKHLFWFNYERIIDNQKMVVKKYIIPIYIKLFYYINI